MPSLRRLVVLSALLATATSASTPAAAQAVPAWHELADSPYHGYRSEDVVFVGRRGWAVNGSGGVWRTDDGGDTWAQTANLFRYLRAATFPTPDIGWVGVLFNETQLYETRDGGLTFTDITARIQPALARGQGLCGMWALDAQTVYAVGQYSSPAYIVKTTDGGATWTQTPMAPLVDELIDVRFFDAQHGLAIGGTGPYDDSRARIIGTDDGGQTWTARHTVADPKTVGWKFTFPTRLVGYASVERLGGAATDALVLKTVDGGQTWAEIRVPDNASLQGIGFATPELGWVSGRGRTSVTTDGGRTWAPVTPTSAGGQLDGDINRFRFYGDSLAYAAGHKVYRLRLPRSTASEDIAGAEAEGIAAVAPNPSRGPVRIAYRVAAPGAVRLEVFDVRGRRVAVLVDRPEAPGEHVAVWEPEAASSGLYVVRMQAGRGVWTRAVSVVGR